MPKGRIKFKVKSNYGRQGKKIAAGGAEIKFSLPQALRKSIFFFHGVASRFSPKDRQSRIPKSLKIYYSPTEASVKTTYPPAFFTEEGTGVAGRWATQPYFIPKDRVKTPGTGNYNQPPPGSFRPAGTAAVFERPGGHMIGFMHSGITPQKWFERAWDRSDKQMLREFDRVMKDALRGKR